MVHFVGAGPGDPELITVKGKRLLEEADVIIYAGSLVNPQLLSLAKPGAEIHNSAPMTLEEVLAVMEQAEAEGKTTVRLHTGDPSVYGAHREQMDALDERGIGYDVTPGGQFLSGRRGVFEEGIHPSGCEPDGDSHPEGGADCRPGEGRFEKPGGAQGDHGDFPQRGPAGGGGGGSGSLLRLGRAGGGGL